MTSVHIQRNLYDLAKIHKINIKETLNTALEKKLENYETLQQKKEKLEKELKEIEQILEAQRVSKEFQVVLSELRQLNDLDKAKVLAEQYTSTFRVSVRELCRLAGYK